MYVKSIHLIPEQLNQLSKVNIYCPFASTYRKLSVLFKKLARSMPVKGDGCMVIPNIKQSSFSTEITFPECMSPQPLEHMEKCLYFSTITQGFDVEAFLY